MHGVQARWRNCSCTYKHNMAGLPPRAILPGACLGPLEAACQRTTFSAPLLPPTLVSNFLTCRAAGS